MTEKQLIVRDEMPLTELGAVLVKSGFFADTRDAAQAIVKIMAGRELGLPTIASMTGVYIVQGRVSLSANILAAVVKRSGRYDYRVLSLDDKACEIAFFQNGQAIGNSRFTAEDAKRAGTKNMEKYPRNMLFARAMSNGVKWYCPDVTGGPVYTPEELGATVNEDGDVTEMPAVRLTELPVIKPANGHAEPVPADVPVRHLGEMATTSDQINNTAVIQASAEGKPAKFAKMGKLSVQNIKGWQDGCKDLASKFPKYQTASKDEKLTGLPNYFHILGAAAKVGYSVVDDSNFSNVIEDVAKRAAEISK
jgi:hypothetical protein